MQSKIDLLDTEYSTWQVTAQFYDQYSNTHWALMQRSQESNGWLNYRLCVLGSSRKKRSYWLAWSRSEQRFARSADAWDFANDLPALKTRLTEYLLRAAEPLPDKATREIQVSVARDALKRIRAATAVKRIQ